jgi:hypothetical protein
VRIVYDANAGTGYAGNFDSFGLSPASGTTA